MLVINNINQHFAKRSLVLGGRERRKIMCRTDRHTCVDPFINYRHVNRCAGSAVIFHIIFRLQFAHIGCCKVFFMLF